jgi:hypothetical protein
MVAPTGAVYDRFMRLTTSLSIIAVAVAAGCSGQATQAVPVAPASCGSVATPANPNDRDNDGLDDAQEQAWAEQYMPFLSLSPGEQCPTAGIIVRVSPLAMPGFVRIVYDVLYDNDCGLNGHIGDDEKFAITVDTAMPPPDGIVSIKAISHRGTICEKESDCGRCPGQSACATLVKNGQAWPAVWSSQNKHGNYVDRSSTCKFDNTCLDDCEDNPTPAMLPIVNVGEPCFPLVTNLTTMGFITMANGWMNQELFNYNPWSGLPFGPGGGVVSTDLTDPAFDTAVCP